MMPSSCLASRTAIVVLVLGLSACASPAPDPGKPADAAGLAGTAWELVQVQSMDDAQGSTRIAEPSRYTLQFGADGRAAMRIDCNRATSTWHASPGPGGDSGSLRFGPVAGTRALCPPPSIDQRVMRDLPFVRGYLHRDGRLHLTLMADGGIYTWRPATPR